VGSVQGWMVDAGGLTRPSLTAPFRPSAAEEPWAAPVEPVVSMFDIIVACVGS